MSPLRRKHKVRMIRTLVGVGLAAVAALVLGLCQGAGTDGDDSSAGRLKGRSRIDFFVLHGGHLRPGAPGEVVAPGDALEFVYHGSESGYLAIISVDAQHRARVFYPEGASAGPIPPAQEAVLANQVRLDPTLGPRTLWVLYCPRPISLVPVRQALEAHPDASPAAEGCRAESIPLVERAPPP